MKLWAAGLVLAVIVAIAGAAAPARAQMLCGLLSCASGPSAGSDACSSIGHTDRNPANEPAVPTLGRPLIARRADGRLPWGFTGLAYTDGSISRDKEFRLHRIVGSDIAKVTLHWGAVEVEQGNPDFRAYDRIYCALLAARLKPVFMLYETPEWAAPECRHVNMCVAAPSIDHLPDLRRFAEQLAIRYPQLAAVEVWNEPNNAARFVNPDPVRYATMLKAAFQGVNDGNPAIPVLGGAMTVAEADKPDGSRAAIPFLDEVFAAGGGAWMDGVSLHAYPRLPQSKGTDRYDVLVGGAREVAARYDGPGRRHIWVSETGGHVQQNNNDFGFTPAAQSEKLIDIYQRSDASSDVDAVIFHQLVDSDGYGWVTEPLNNQYRGRPVFCAFAHLLGQGADCSRNIRF